ncbi:hypothetical protein GQR58_028981 [Nymphon striatum]|nr:hypothetical protein GQR58_028981 [Nymphon striatum]
MYNAIRSPALTIIIIPTTLRATRIGVFKPQQPACAHIAFGNTAAAESRIVTLAKPFSCLPEPAPPATYRQSQLQTSTEPSAKHIRPHGEHRQREPHPVPQNPLSAPARGHPATTYAPATSAFSPQSLAKNARNINVCMPPDNLDAKDGETLCPELMVQQADSHTTDTGGARIREHRNHRHQHQHRAEEGIEEELEAGVNPVRPAPDANDQEHRNEARFKEQIEQDSDPAP